MTGPVNDIPLTGFERLLNRLALESINIPVHQIDIQLKKLLMLIGKHTDVERCYIATFTDDMNEIYITHDWSPRGFTPTRNRIMQEHVPADWIKKKRTELIVLPDIASAKYRGNAGPEAVFSNNIQSALLVPLFLNEKFSGILGFSSVKKINSFSEELKSVFRVAAELVVNLYEKKTIYSQLELAENIVSRTISSLAFFDRNGLLQFSNTSFNKSFTVRKKNGSANSFYSIFSDIDESTNGKLHKKFKAALSGKTAQIEVWKKNRDNLSLYEIYLHPNKKEDGIVTGVIFNARDITDRVQLEAGILKAIYQERKRIGILLHDDLGHDLLAADIRLKLLSDSAREVSPSISDELVDIEKSVKDMMNDVRRLSHGLIPFKNQGLDLREMLDAATIMMNKYYGLHCSYTIHPDVNISSESVISELYNIIIESAVNAVKHSGCDSISIDLYPETSLYILKITDNGQGIQESKLRFPGAGLEIMRYRARTIGGMLEISGNRNRGTTVKVSFNPERINQKGVSI